MKQRGEKKETSRHSFPSFSFSGSWELDLDASTGPNVLQAKREGCNFRAYLSLWFTAEKEKRIGRKNVGFNGETELVQGFPGLGFRG